MQNNKYLLVRNIMEWLDSQWSLKPIDLAKNAVVSKQVTGSSWETKSLKSVILLFKIKKVVIHQYFYTEIFVSFCHKD